MKNIFKLFSLTISIIILTACSSLAPLEEGMENYEEAQKEKFTLSDDYGYSDDYGFAYYIEGLVKNNTDKSYSYVQVTFNVYDSEDNLLGSCWDNVNNLKENGTWKIKAICSGDAKNIVRYELEDFTSW